MGKRITERFRKEAENKRLKELRRDRDKLKIGTKRKILGEMEQTFKTLDAERNELLRKKEIVEESLHNKRIALANAEGLHLSKTKERIKRLEGMLDDIDARLALGIPEEKARIAKRTKELELLYHR